MRTEDKVMKNGKLQAKQEKLKSLHCPSPQSSLFSSRDSLLNTQHSKESAIRCAQPLFIDVSTELLRRGQSVRFRAPGLSMHPTIKEGETITVVPISSFDIKRGDILLYLVGKKVIAHRVVRIKREKNDFKSQSSARGEIQSTPDSSPNSSIHASNRSKKQNSQILFVLRGDASLTSDEPVETEQILGKVVSVERDGRSINLCSRKAKIFHLAYTCASRLKRWMIRILLRMKTFNGRQPS
jgi:hypothetical protein